VPEITYPSDWLGCLTVDDGGVFEASELVTACRRIDVTAHARWGRDGRRKSTTGTERRGGRDGPGIRPFPRLKPARTPSVHSLFQNCCLTSAERFYRA